MDIIATKGGVIDHETELLAITVSKNSKELHADLDGILEGMLKNLAKEEGFNGEVQTSLMLRTQGKVKAKRILLLGLGEEKDITEESLRRAAALAIKQAKKIKVSDLTFELPQFEQLNAKKSYKALTEGFLLGAYEYLDHKDKEKDEKLTKATILTNDGRAHRVGEAGIDIGQFYAEGSIYTRDLVNAPAGHMTPKELVEKAREAVKGMKNVKIRVYDKDALELMGAGGLLGIAQGSDHPPFMVHMTYTPEKATKKSVALVGKAVTFDSGGYSIKPWQSMTTMKCDMAGAAAVIGVFSQIDKIAPKAEVHGIFGACENMISGNAIRPGDVVKTMNGKTIEILHTDAEGRVTLADTLFYASKQKPDVIVDLATLTGAAMVAVGDEYTALMTNDQKWADKVMDAAKEEGELMWQLPVVESYKKDIKSKTADYKNEGGRWGGTIKAALLLREFIDNTPWVHLDIAGPAFADKPLNTYTPYGGTGHPVRTLAEFLKTL